MHALIIETSEIERSFLQKLLREDGWHVTGVGSIAESQAVIESRRWNLVFCDAQLATKWVDGGLIQLLNLLKREIGPLVQLVLTDAPGKSINPFEAVLNGATDYIRRPCHEEAVREISVRARERLIAAEREESVQAFSPQVDAVRTAHNGHHLIGDSEAITKVYKALARIVRDNQTVGGQRRGVERAPAFLITGETGTGKELVARLIHRHSRYSRGSFVPVNCSNLSAELADVELFGSSPGAYTGAPKEEQMGLWELASGGTLFLDEITEAPRAVLPKLLRVLQEGQIKRLGAKPWINVDTQVIAATNRNVQAEIKSGHFRADLYHRLSLFTVHLPSLRERIDDVPLLAMHFANLYSGGTCKLSGDALALLVEFSEHYAWPGNVRELENSIRRAITHSSDKIIYAIDLAEHLPENNVTTGADSSVRESLEASGKHAGTLSGKHDQGGLEERVKRFKGDVVKETLEAHNGNRSRAASSLGVSRPKLHRLLKELEQGS